MDYEELREEFSLLFTGNASVHNGLLSVMRYLIDRDKPVSEQKEEQERQDLCEECRKEESYSLIMDHLLALEKTFEMIATACRQKREDRDNSQR